MVTPSNKKAIKQIVKTTYPFFKGTYYCNVMKSRGQCLKKCEGANGCLMYESLEDLFEEKNNDPSDDEINECVVAFLDKKIREDRFQYESYRYKDKILKNNIYEIDKDSNNMCFHKRFRTSKLYFQPIYSDVEKYGDIWYKKVGIDKDATEYADRITIIANISIIGNVYYGYILKSKNAYLSDMLGCFLLHEMELVR